MALQQLKWQPDEPAELRVLTEGTDESISVRILDIAGKRMHVESVAKVNGGTPVRVDWGGQLVLGQVADPGPGTFWIDIHHMLLDATVDWQKQGWRG